MVDFKKAQEDLWIRRIEKEGYEQPHDIFRSNLLVEVLKRLNRFDKNAVVLDVGCAFGNELERLVSVFNFKKENVFGVDISNTFIERGKKSKWLNDKNLLCESMFKMRFGTQFSDVLFTCAVLQHTHDDVLQDALNEFLRVAKDGSLLVHVEMNTERNITDYFENSNRPSEGVVYARRDLSKLYDVSKAKCLLHSSLSEFSTVNGYNQFVSSVVVFEKLSAAKKSVAVNVPDREQKEKVEQSKKSKKANR